MSLPSPLLVPGHALVPDRASVLCRIFLKSITHNPQHYSGVLAPARAWSGSAWHLVSLSQPGQPRPRLCEGDGEKMLDKGQQKCHDLAVHLWALQGAGIFGVGSLPMHSMIATGKTVWSLWRWPWFLCLWKLFLFVDNNLYIKELKYCIHYVTMSASSHCSCFPLALILKRQFKPGGFCSRRSRGEQHLTRVTPCVNSYLVLLWQKPRFPVVTTEMKFGKPWLLYFSRRPWDSLEATAEPSWCWCWLHGLVDGLRWTCRESQSLSAHRGAACQWGPWALESWFQLESHLW